MTTLPVSNGYWRLRGRARRGRRLGTAAAAGGAFALVLAILAVLVDTTPPASTVRFGGRSMGTSYSITVPGADEHEESLLSTAVRVELDLVDGLMSTYRPDSELSRLNRHSSGEPFALSEQTFDVLDAARRASELTSGAFDVTVGPLVDAWGFGPGGPTAEPSDEEVAGLLQASGWGNLLLDPARRSARKTVPKLRCDLSAIAKGYAVDRVSAALEDLGFPDHLVEVGGELVARGTNPRGQAWRVGIERPDAAGRLAHRVLRIRDTAVATSGDYRNFRESEGRRYSHVLDPRTGRPATSLVASATVLDPTATMADALATALLVVGEAEAVAIAERENLAVLLLVRDGEGGFRETASSRFRATMSGGAQ